MRGMILNLAFVLTFSNVLLAHSTSSEGLHKVASSASRTIRAPQHRVPGPTRPKVLVRRPDLNQIVVVKTDAFAEDKRSWPCYHGSRRDNLSADTSLLQTWPEEGPKLLWTASDIGFGYSSVAVVGSFRPPRGGKGLFWAHPVVCDGRLYIRHAEKLFVYDVR